ncbi:unannotated protein [freshwater metagenome]|uniref:Unannotated protein n=1 Tax=freshwater metagenome TaxID=449393 RepID=A0A6J6RSN5_9ZZZZ
MPPLPTINALVGKSGPLTIVISFASSSSDGISGFSNAKQVASTTSFRLCGGIFVAMPTAIPAEPFTNKLGNLLGRTVGS